MRHTMDLAAVREAEKAVHALLTPTPLFRHPDLNAQLGRSVWLKLELFQPTGSFKPRGVLNWLARASTEQLSGGLVTVTAGNHGAALAWGAREYDTPVTAVMPEGSSPLKMAACREHGARVLTQPDIGRAIEHMQRLHRDEGLTVVHPYDDPAIIAGQGSMALELLAQGPTPDLVVCPVGGGGLISGLGIVLQACTPRTRLIGVEPEGAPTLSEAWRYGQPRALTGINTLALSLAAGIAGEYTLALSRQVVDSLVTVTDAEIRQAQRLVMTRARLYAEPGAVVAIAALQSGRIEVNPQERVVCIVTGGNLDPEMVSAVV